MTSKVLRCLLAVAVFSMISAWAQTGGAATTPSSPAAATASPAAPTTTAGTKVGSINAEAAVFAFSNEGRRDADALQKKLEPKQNELKAQKEELESLQKQLETQGDKLNEDAKATLVKQIETKKKAFERAAQDFQEEGQGQFQEIFFRILQKMGPMIVKYAQDNGFVMIVDTSERYRWPQGQVLWTGESVDITKAVTDAYNVSSGVPAPSPTGASKTPTKPATTKPATAAPKPAAPPTTPPK
jgi:outer membrane protein